MESDEQVMLSLGQSSVHFPQIEQGGCEGDNDLITILIKCLKQDDVDSNGRFNIQGCVVNGAAL